MSLLKESIEQLETVGYCRLPSLYSKSVMKEALEKIRWYYDRCKDSDAENVPFLNIGQPSLYNLQSKDIFFLKLLFEPKILEDVLIHFLNDRWFKQIPPDQPNYTLRSFIARSTSRVTAMHLDSFIPYLSPEVFVMQFAIILEDQNSENGCTVVVPKSHLSGQYTTQEAFSEAVPVESEVGDVVIWDSRLWHGTRENRTEGTRWSIIATVCRWWLKQHWNIPQNLPQEIYSQTTDSQKAVLGFCSISPKDETQGIDLKSGYDSLPPDVGVYRQA